MFKVVDKIDKALESKENCTLIDKMGKFYHGNVVDSWACISGGKLRGKVKFLSEEKGEFIIEATDIVDLVLVEGKK